MSHPAGAVAVALAATLAVHLPAARATPAVAKVSPAAAPAGTNVTITGTDLAGATEIDFTGSSLPAWMVSDTPTKIVVRVPQDATIGPIVVHTTDGDALTGSFTPLPVVYALEELDGFPGDAVTIEGANLSGASAVTFGSLAATITSVTATGVVATVPDTPFSSGKVSVTTPAGVTTSRQAFAVTKATKLSTTSAVAGKTLTVRGQGLGSATAVRFFTGYTGIAVPTYHDVAVSGAPTATSVTAVVPPDAQTGVVTVVTPRGAAATTAQFAPRPLITALSAADGIAGDAVAITGSNLGAVQAVTFGGQAAEVTNATATEVDVSVPDAPFSSGKVSVTTPAGTAVSSQPFSITKLTSFTPVSAPAGAVVTIKGQGLGSTTHVKFFAGFSGLLPTYDSVTVKRATATAVTAVVPPDAQTGTLELVGSHAFDTTADFTPLPRITGIAPANATVGETVLVEGSNLAPASVTFGGLDADTVDATATQIHATVPDGFTGGKVAVRTTGGTAVWKATFAVPKATSVTPATAAAGAVVTIHGHGLSSITVVAFPKSIGTVAVAIHGKARATSVQVVVPDVAVAGDLQLEDDAGGSVSTANAFRPQPRLTALAPLDGLAPLGGGTVPGTSVTIAGTNLSGATAVAFGGVPASFTQVNATQIDTTVPDGFTDSGKISVTTPLGVATSPTPFEITVATSISPATAAPGTTVTITGRGLGSTSIVGFYTSTDGFACFPDCVDGVAVTRATATSLKVRVPDDAVAGPALILTASTYAAAIAGFPTETPAFTPLPVVASLSAADGVPGNVVAIDGAGFGGGVDAVTFGSTPATSFTAISPTEVDATVPDGFSSGRVTVSTPHGTATSKQRFAITTVTGLSPASAAGGTTITITGTGLADAKSVDFAGHFGQDVTSATATAVKVVVPDDAEPGTLRVISRYSEPSPTSWAVTSTATFAPKPAISSLSATDGIAGMTVTIHGADLDTATAVAFGTSPATITSASTTALAVTVPAAPFSSGKVKVTTPSGTVTSAQTFTITQVTKVAPTTAVAGATVTLTGRGLAHTSFVLFQANSTAQCYSAPDEDCFEWVVPSSATASTVKAAAPADAINGRVYLFNANVGEDAASLIGTSAFFEPLPTIASFSPDPLQAGGTVTVSGANLDAGGSPTVKLGTTAVDATSITATSLAFVVPDGAVTAPVTLDNGNGSTTSHVLLHVRPTVDSVSVTHAAAGDIVVLGGKTFTGTKSVTFGGDTHSARFTVSADGSSVTVTVPTTAVSGAISVTNAGGTTETDPFLVDPVIAGISPQSAPVGAIVTVTGTGLADTDFVGFTGDVSAVHPTTTSATSLQVVVPDRAQPGPISVHTEAGGHADSAASLLVTYSVFGIDPAVAVYSHPVTLTGIGLTSGVTGVAFNGNPVAFTVVSDTQIRTTTPGSGDITGPVTVTRSGSTTNAGTFTLLSVTSFSPASGTVGQTVTLHGTGFDDVTSVSFNGVDAGSFDVDAPDGTITATVPDGATAGSISVTAPGGTAASSDSFEVIASGITVDRLNRSLVELHVARGGALPDEALEIYADGDVSFGLSLPGITVVNGDAIVFHLDDTATTESSSKTDCTDASCFSGAWDVAAPLGALPPGPIVLTAPFDTVVVTDKTRTWDTDLLAALATVQSAGGWATCSGSCDSAGADSVAVDWSSLSGGDSALRTGGDSNTAGDWSIGPSDFG